MTAEPPLPRLAAVVGWPVGHSLSPEIHRFWAERETVNGFYVPVAAPDDDEAFARVVGGLKAAGFRGVNVTVPHKERALALADRASETARAAGAANMLTFAEGVVVADNSDVAGFAEAVEAVAPGAVRGGRALILGAGGAAKAVLVAVESRLGASIVSMANRTTERLDFARGRAGVEVVPWADRDRAAAAADLVVNATSLGMAGQPPLELDISGLRPSAVVCDIVYAPLETPLLKAARARGLRTVDGLEMLMRQAAPGYRAWLGSNAVVDKALRNRLLDVVTARGGG